MLDYIELGGIRLYHGDNMDWLRATPDKYYQLAIVDPPYGININMNMGLAKGKRKRHKQKQWDNCIPSPEYFEELFRVSKNQIIWGGNYFPLPANKHFIFWDKEVPEGLSFSDGEYAWTSFDRAIRKFTLRNTGGGKIHPTEKPVKLYKWLLHNYAVHGEGRILDTHFGSLNIGVACHEYGFELDACEADDEYFENGVKRLRAVQSQATLNFE